MIELDLTWDATTDVAYLTLAPTTETDRLGPTMLLENDPEFNGAVAADFTVADGRLVGLEFRMASTSLPRALLARARRIDGEHLRQRFDQRLGRQLGPGRHLEDVGGLQ